MLFAYLHIMEICNSREKHNEYIGRSLVTPNDVWVSWVKHVGKKLDTHYTKQPTGVREKPYSVFDNQT